MADAGTDSLRRFHTTEDAKMSLVVLPHAGGAASYYFKLSEAMSKFVQVYVVQYPGRHDRRREPFATDIRTLAADIQADIARRISGPVALFGHSMGAVVSYEIASGWPARSNASLTGLFASSRVAPSVPFDIPDLRTTDQAIAEIQGLGGTDMRVLADREFFASAVEVMRQDYGLLVRYQQELPRLHGHQIDVPIRALAPTSDRRAPIEQVMDWKLHTTAGFDLRTFDGGHFYINDRIDEVVDYVRESVSAEWSATGAQS
ncbi:thioesterase II family protein [Nocardia sp. NPDC056952]|uniref:thioesterase II family protein n=1 Tax=Nocardia sp. NPDC056952 TaxID=3345979 RepID=UPI003629E5C7